MAVEILDLQGKKLTRLSFSRFQSNTKGHRHSAIWPQTEQLSLRPGGGEGTSFQAGEGREPEEGGRERGARRREEPRQLARAERGEGAVRGLLDAVSGTGTARRETTATAPGKGRGPGAGAGAVT